MKNLIITAGIIIFVVAVTGMQFTCSKMLHNKQELKSFADEAASTAALYMKEKKSNQKKAESEAQKITSLNMPQGEYDLAIEYLSGKRPAVRAIIKKEKLIAVSKYEYVPY